MGGIILQDLKRLEAIVTKRKDFGAKKVREH